ncbi:hypothetical protein ACWGKU_20460 [Kitasatospora sp. NPDC054768]
MTQAQIEKRLHLAEVDHGELATLLMFEFGSSSTADSKRVYYPDATPGALLLEYSGSKIWRILPQPGLTDQVVLDLEQRVQEELLAPPVRKVARFILYSGKRAHGYWAHGDRLVLRQPPPQAPQAHEWSELHPLLCEVAYEGANEHQLDSYRRQRAARHTKLLLTFLIPGLTDRAEPSLRTAWVLPAVAIREAEPDSVCMQQIHLIKGFDAVGGDLAEQADLPAMPVADDLYEAMPWERSLDPELVLPGTLGADIDRFQALSRTGQREFLRAAFWHHQARLLRHRSHSASYQALVQSIEVLAAATPTSNGARKQFKAFLQDYVHGSWDGADELYRLRSLIAHGNTLMLADEEEFGLGPNPRAQEERRLHDQAEAVSRAAAINWLRGLKTNPAVRV